MANAFVKAAIANGNAVAFGSAVSAGNLIVGMVTYAAAETVSSVTDSVGNTYALLTEVEDVADAQAARMFYAMNVGAGTPTVTANGVTNGDGTTILVHEVSGAATTAALGQQGGQVDVNPGTGANACNSGSVTTGTDGEYIFGTAVLSSDFSDGIANFAAGTGFTERTERNVLNNLGVTSEDQVQVSAGAIDATFTVVRGAQTYIVLISTFKAAGGAAASVFKPDSMLLMGVS